MHARTRRWLACIAAACLAAVGVACSAPTTGAPTRAATGAPKALATSASVPGAAEPPTPASTVAASAPAAAVTATPASTPAAGAQPQPAAGAARPAPSPAAGSAFDPNWLTYQHDAARSGQTSGRYDAASTKLAWESEALDGLVYAQVLVMRDRAFVVTQNNTVYALDAASGRTIWSQHLGDPVPRSVLPCGNIDPTGITSTPVIDANAGVLYAVDFLRTQPPRHELVALDLNSGSVKFHVPIDPPGANPLPHQQRGGLAVSNGTVYVPFGGLFGDCGDYHGWVVAASGTDGSQRSVYQVPTQREGAIWSAPALNDAGDVFVATGNGASTTEFDHANAVLRLSPDLKLLDFFAPGNWADLSRRDADLGSTGPTLLDNGRILQVGKSGVGYLLLADKLGQIGGEAFQAALCGGGAYGGSGHAGSMVYVPCRDGLYAVQVQDRTFNVVWRGPPFNAGAPTITGGVVWTVDDGTTSLYALNRLDGSVLFRAPAGQASNPPHFLTPSAAGGRIFHSRGRTVVAYGAG